MSRTDIILSLASLTFSLFPHTLMWGSAETRGAKVYRESDMKSRGPTWASQLLLWRLQSLFWSAGISTPVGTRDMQLCDVSFIPNISQRWRIKTSNANALLNLSNGIFSYEPVLQCWSTETIMLKLLFGTSVTWTSKAPISSKILQLNNQKEKAFKAGASVLSEPTSGSTHAWALEKANVKTNQGTHTCTTQPVLTERQEVD